MSEYRRPRKLAVLVVGGATVIATLVAARVMRRWYNRDGATAEELARPLPGDDLVPNPKLGYTRAITIQAPPDDVWPWLVQIGQGRGGFYSHDTIENLIGCDIHSTDEILAEHQHLDVGDIIRSGPDSYPCWVVMNIEAPHRLVLHGAGTPNDVEIPDIVDEAPPKGYAASTWQWILEPTADGARTRLLVRQRCTYSPAQAILWHIVEPLNYIMERRMLRGIKARAERHTRSARRNDPASRSAMFPLEHSR